jgi:hypothetical protein
MVCDRLFVIAFLLIFFAARMKKPSEDATNVTLKIDLPGDVKMESIKCKSCGAPLAEAISKWSMVHPWSPVPAVALPIS